MSWKEFLSQQSMTSYPKANTYQITKSGPGQKKTQNRLKADQGQKGLKQTKTDHDQKWWKWLIKRSTLNKFDMEGERDKKKQILKYWNKSN